MFRFPEFVHSLSVRCSFYMSLIKVYVSYYPLTFIKTVYSVKCHGFNPSMTKWFFPHLKLGSIFFRISLCLFTILTFYLVEILWCHWSDIILICISTSWAYWFFSCRFEINLSHVWPKNLYIITLIGRLHPCLGPGKNNWPICSII